MHSMKLFNKTNEVEAFLHAEIFLSLFLFRKSQVISLFLFRKSQVITTETLQLINAIYI